MRQPVAYPRTGRRRHRSSNPPREHLEAEGRLTAHLGGIISVWVAVRRPFHLKLGSFKPQRTRRIRRNPLNQRRRSLIRPRYQRRSLPQRPCHRPMPRCYRQRQYLCLSLCHGEMEKQRKRYPRRALIALQNQHLPLLLEMLHRQGGWVPFGLGLDIPLNYRLRKVAMEAKRVSPQKPRLNWSRKRPFVMMQWRPPLPLRLHSLPVPQTLPSLIPTSQMKSILPPQVLTLLQLQTPLSCMHRQSPGCRSSLRETTWLSRGSQTGLRVSLSTRVEWKSWIYRRS